MKEKTEPDIFEEIDEAKVFADRAGLKLGQQEPRPTEEEIEKAAHVIADLSIEQRKAFVTIIRGMTANYEEEIEKLKKDSLRLDTINKQLSLAWEAYNEPGKRQDERARAALQILNFTDGKRQPRFNKKNLFFEYCVLINGPISTSDPVMWKEMPEPMSKEDAVTYLAKKYETTYGAIHQQLQKHRSELKKKLIRDNMSTDDLRGLLPPAKPSNI